MEKRRFSSRKNMSNKEKENDDYYDLKLGIRNMVQCKVQCPKNKG